MNEFWEKLFKNGRDLWGSEPADSALIAAEMFQVHGCENVLIPGIGYGRNALPFIANKMEVNGIEISKTAIEILNEQSNKIRVHHGSVLQMPFDEKFYDGIFCYALLHLFGPIQRKRILKNCYAQLNKNGMMIFSVISTESTLLKGGEQISKNRYLLPNGLKVYFYDDAAIEKEFSSFGLSEFKDIDEPVKFIEGEPPMKFKLIICKK